MSYMHASILPSQLVLIKRLVKADHDSFAADDIVLPAVHIVMPQPAGSWKRLAGALRIPVPTPLMNNWAILSDDYYN